MDHTKITILAGLDYDTPVTRRKQGGERNLCPVFGDFGVSFVATVSILLTKGGVAPGFPFGAGPKWFQRPFGEFGNFGVSFVATLARPYKRWGRWGVVRTFGSGRDPSLSRIS